MELWERSEALDLLSRFLRESANGGRIALVAGEAGIGKSALVREFVRRSGANARVLWGACDRLVTPRALGPLHDIGHQIGGRLAAQLRSAAPQEEIFGAFLDELAAGRSSRQHVVVVEDAHWADEATLDWLAVLGRRADRLSALLVVTYRSDEVGPDHPLRGVLAALPSAVVRRVPITPLSAECVREQAGRAGRDGDSVYQLAGGNPLLVTELLKIRDEPIPDAVQDLILDRMRALPPPARDLAQLVAVVPTRADAPLIANAAEQVEACLAAGVLVPAGDGVSFRHELLRSAVEDSLSPVRRSALHRQVLTVLMKLPDVDPGRLVHHASLADDRDAVLHFGPIAAAAAARQGAHREATRHYRAAAAYAERLADPDHAELLERYAEQAHLAGANEEALQARRDALAIWERLGQVARSAENLRWISQLAWWAGQVTGMREAADRALQMLASLPPSKELAMAYVAQAQLSFRVNELAESAAWADRAVELAHQLGEQEISLHASVTRDTARLAAGRSRGLGQRWNTPTSPATRPGSSTRRPGPCSAWPPWSRTSSPASPTPRRFSTGLWPTAPSTISTASRYSPSGSGPRSGSNSVTGRAHWPTRSPCSRMAAGPDLAPCWPWSRRAASRRRGTIRPRGRCSIRPSRPRRRSVARTCWSRWPMRVRNTSCGRVTRSARRGRRSRGLDLVGRGPGRRSSSVGWSGGCGERAASTELGTVAEPYRQMMNGDWAAAADGVGRARRGLSADPRVGDGRRGGRGRGAPAAGRPRRGPSRLLRPGRAAQARVLPAAPRSPPLHYRQCRRADPTSGRGARAGRAGPVQCRHRGTADPLPQDRRPPCVGAAGQTGCGEPGPGRRHRSSPQPGKASAP